MHARASRSHEPAALAGKIRDGPRDSLTAHIEVLRKSQATSSKQQTASNTGVGPRPGASLGVSTPPPYEPNLPPGSEAVTIPQVADVTQW